MQSIIFVLMLSDLLAIVSPSEERLRPWKTKYRSHEPMYHVDENHVHGIIQGCDGNRYEGEWLGVTGSPDGKGTMYFLNGNIFAGQWKNGEREFGKFTSKTNGWFYEGQFERSMPHGFGEIIYGNGDRYKGSFKQGLMNGNGKFKWSNGMIYDGECLDGLIHGKGAITHPGKWRWEGNFINGRAQGKGRKWFPDGRIVECDWSDEDRISDEEAAADEARRMNHGKRLFEEFEMRTDDEMRLIKERAMDDKEYIHKISAREKETTQRYIHMSNELSKHHQEIIMEEMPDDDEDSCYNESQ